MKTIVFLGTHKSGSSREAIKSAEKLGYFTCLLTNNQKHLKQREEFKDVHLMKYCELKDIDKIKECIIDLQLRSFKICAIVSFIDPWCGLASILAKDFGLNHFTTDAILSMQSKLKSREILNDTNLIPSFLTISEETRVHTLNYPIVVKHTDSNGSKDVYLCNDELSYKNNTSRLFEKYPGCTLLVEEYLDGPQYLIETLVIDDKVHIIAIIEQDIQFLNGHFIITGYHICIDYTKEFYNQLHQAVSEVIEKHQFHTGPCHLEMRYVNNTWKLIEINPRISGAGMNTLLEIGLGINLVEETLKLSLNEEVNTLPLFKNNTFCEYIVVNQSGKLLKVTGKHKALNSKGVKSVYIKPRIGSTLIPPVSLGNRYAYVIATGINKEDAKMNAKEAAKMIQFHLIDK